MKVNKRDVKTLLTESYTITNQEIRLNEAADLGEPITISGFTRVYTTPNAGQFQVLTFEEDGVQYGGKIIFNSADEGKSVSVTYYGWGSIIWAEDFNNHENRIKQNETNIANHENRITQNETNITNHENRITTLENDLQSSSYSTPVEEIAQVIHLPNNVVKGQISAVVGGRTYPNLLGNDGDCEDITYFYAGRTTLELVTDSVFGTYAVKATANSENNSHYARIRNSNSDFYRVKENAYYFMAGYVKTNSYVNIAMIPVDESNTQVGNSSISENTNSSNFVRLGCKINTPIGTVKLISQVNLLDSNQSSSFAGNGEYAVFDGFILVEITQDEYNNLTVDELMEKYPFINGTKSTISHRLRSVGKNLLPQNLKTNYANITYLGDGKYQLTSTGSAWGYVVPIKIPVIAGKSYTIQAKKSDVTIGGRIEFRCFNEAGEYITTILQLTEFQSNDVSYAKTDIIPNGIKYIMPRIVSDTAGANSPVITSGTTTVLYDIQLEQGDTATEYEEYKESVVYLDETLRSLPNGVKDEINVSEGRKIQRVSEEYVLQESDIEEIYTGGTNIDIVKTRVFTEAKDGTAEINGIVNVYGKQETTNVDTTDNIGKFSYDADNRIRFYVAKGTYAALAEAQADLAGTTLIYQLAEPIEHDLNITPLECFENGTLYVEQIVRDSGIYSGGLSVSNTNLPIDSLEAVYKIEGDTKTPIDISDCTVAGDGLSFTIVGAIDGEKYEYVYFYPKELGTVGTVEYSVPLNRAAQIDDNTKMINQLSEELGDLWETLLPLTDKELAMALIADITTDMSTDAFANELKNKINEILNVW